MTDFGGFSDFLHLTLTDAARGAIALATDTLRAVLSDKH